MIVAGGIRRAGGQDRANLELARYLATSGRRLILVANRVDPEVRGFSNTSVHVVTPPLGSNALGEILLRRTAASLRTRLPPDTVVLANGGNFRSRGASWIHCVHAVWEPRDDGAPLHWRLLAHEKKRRARAHEREALRDARVLVANSRKTARDLEGRLGVPGGKIVVVYFGADPARPQRPAGQRFRIGFIGALGWDRNKGLDTVLQAFRLAGETIDPRYRLVVAGGGASGPWVERARRLGITERVDFAGFVDDIPALLDSIDILVSPVRYEAYGLAVQEALLQGVPALVSRTAGVSERMESVPGFLITDIEDPRAWSTRLVETIDTLPAAQEAAQAVGRELSSWSWADMAEEIARVLETRLPARPRSVEARR
jgi:glycosyltransferase involved in cell wall biosynthesis